MEIHELESLWRSANDTLDAQYTRRMVMAGGFSQVKRPLRKLTAALLCEAGAASCLTLALGSFLFNHAAEPRFAWPAAMIDLWAIAALATTLAQLVFVHAIDYDQPVVAIQSRIAALRLLRLRVIRWALLTGLVVWWLPFLVVACKAVLGIDAFQVFGMRFFYVNGLANGLMVPAAVWLARRLSRGTGGSAFLQALARHLEGSYITTAYESIQSISRFARDHDQDQEA
jgi:hypothetical protein